MFFCENCGQSPHINDDSFLEYRNVSGWESNYVSPHDGDYLEYANGETTDGDHDYYECPYCQSANVDSMWQGSLDEALACRDRYRERVKESNARRDDLEKRMDYEQKAKDPARQWDVETNV